MKNHFIVVTFLTCCYVTVATKCPIPQSNLPSCQVIPDSPAPGQVSGIAAFKYSRFSINGPARWSQLECKRGIFARFRGCTYCQNTCGGRMQSPINLIVRKAVPKSARIAPEVNLASSANLMYKITPGSFELTCRKPGTCGEITFQKQRFELDNVHMHRFSEHMLNNFRLPLEMHFVHARGNERLVVAVFYKLGKYNPELQKFLDISRRRCVGAINLKKLAASAVLKTLLLFYRGSLTTPPCTEGTDWFVSGAPLEASSEQIATFSTLIGSSIDSRPVQPLNGRRLIRFV